MANEKTAAPTGRRFIPLFFSSYGLSVSSRLTTPREDETGKTEAEQGHCTGFGNLLWRERRQIQGIAVFVVRCDLEEK